MKISKTFRINTQIVELLNHIPELNPEYDKTKAIEEAIKIMHWILMMKKHYNLEPEEAAKCFESWYRYRAN